MHQNLLAQNLVPNSSFEEYKKCPTESANFAVLEWKSPNKASPDYFNSCSTNKSTSPIINFAGSQLPHSGNGYIGISLTLTDFQNFREYIQCQLLKPLKKNHIYCCTFYVSLSDKSLNYTDRIGLFLSKKRIKGRNKLVLNIKPQIENRTGLYIDNTEEWNMICDTFRAGGNERYITIGNFYDYERTLLKTVNNAKELKKKFPNTYHNSTMNDAYYYIDEVSVIEIADSTPCNCNQLKKDTTPVIITDRQVQKDTLLPKIGKKTVFKNLVFETNKSEILPSSYEELNKLAEYLIKNLLLKIELSGHTDNVGKEEDNQELSEARAKAVAEYLTKKGIVKERISYKGYGSVKPLSTNETEDGRLLNRRVEFMLN